MSEKMKNTKLNVTQYQTALLKMYSSANFERTLWMRTVDEDLNYSSFIFNEKYITTIAEYHKKKQERRRRTKQR